jgi:hypothetical protein
MVLLYGRGGRLTGKAGDFRPGQVRQGDDGLWRFSHWEMQTHFARKGIEVNGRQVCAVKRIGLTVRNLAANSRSKGERYRKSQKMPISSLRLASSIG